MINISNLIGGKSVFGWLVCLVISFSSSRIMADDCRLSVILDRTEEMGSADITSSKCAIGLDFAIGVVEGFMQGKPTNFSSSVYFDIPLAALVSSPLYTSKCLRRNRKVKVITISAVQEFSSATNSHTKGFIDPVIALSQLQKLQLTDRIGSSSCSSHI